MPLGFAGSVGRRRGSAPIDGWGVGREQVPGEEVCLDLHHVAWTRGSTDQVIQNVNIESRSLVALRAAHLA